MSKTLMTLGAICFAVVTIFTMTSFYSIQPPVLKSSESSQTIEWLEFCLIKSCAHFWNVCQADSDCVAEFTQLQASFAADTSSYNALRASASNANLVALLKCSDQCGLADYLNDCGSDLLYVQQCIQDENCRAQNEEYFDNAEMCLSRDYKVCNGKEGELLEICHYTEIVYCLSDGIVGTNTPFENAIMCV